MAAVQLLKAGKLRAVQNKAKGICSLLIVCFKGVLEIDSTEPAPLRAVILVRGAMLSGGSLRSVVLSMRRDTRQPGPFDADRVVCMCTVLPYAYLRVSAASSDNSALFCPALSARVLLQCSPRAWTGGQYRPNRRSTGLESGSVEVLYFLSSCQNLLPYSTSALLLL